VELAVSVGISPRQPLRSFAEQAAELEEAGVGRLWLIDSQLAMKDVYTGLSLAALATERMTLGTGVTNLHTRHPTVTANAIAAVAELSGGRAALGLGAGDSAVYGLGRKPSKVAEVREALSFFSDVLNQRTGTWEQREYELAQSAPATPVHLAVSQPRMCRLAGELADGAIVMGPAQPDLLARQLGWIEEGLARGGRDRSQITIGFITTLSMSDDPERALRDVRSWSSAQARLQADAVDLLAGLGPFAEELARAKADYDYGEHLSTRAGHQGTVSDELVRTLAVAGSPEECTARVRGLLDTGVDSLIFPLMGTGRLERLASIREHILPIIDQGAQHGSGTR
jgi:5,10-methylenetetrahydromethanopterin reductase